MVKKVKISLKDTSYHIHIGNNLLTKINNFHKNRFNDRPKILTYDKNLSETPILSVIRKKLGSSTRSIAIEPGEKSKSIMALEKLYNNLIKAGVDRGTVIYVFGGGVAGDLVGFAASTILRGLDYVQIPTTLLSQIDSSVGGKTAINSKYGKNLIGSFYQPSLVLIDIDTLKTLSERQMKSGYAEMIKYAIINDLSFFKWLEKNGTNILSKNNSYLEESIKKCVISKAKIVSLDEREKKQRTLLNLGHTFAHAFEKKSNFTQMTHGEAVSVGIVLAAKLSSKLKYCKEVESNRIENHLKSLKLPTELKHLFSKNIKATSLIESMKLDKKNYNNVIRFILIKGIGKAFICDKVEENDLKNFLTENGAT